MITLQHALCDYLKFEGNIDFFRSEIPYCLLPDGIRAYIGARPYSHFEENPDKTDISWYSFPSDLKNLTKDNALLEDKHLAEISKKSCLGETSHVDKFVETNGHLPKDYYDGVLTHLIQDYIFDEWIRDNIDCSSKYEPNATFEFQGKTYNSDEIRQVIKEIEEYGFYLLAYICYYKYGIVTNQEWFDENVYPELQKAYPQDLADNTYKYMKIPEDINEKISNKDWSGLKNPKYNVEYEKLYTSIVKYTYNPNLFFNEEYKEKKENTTKYE